MRLSELNPPRRHAWEARWRERPSFRPPPNRERFDEWVARTIEVDGRDVGTAAVGFGPSDSPTTAFVDDVEIAPEYRGRGLGRTARGLLIDWARERGATELRATTTPSDPAANRLFEDFTVMSRHLRLPVTAADHRRDDGVVPMTDEAFPRWLDLMLDDFATSFADRLGGDVNAARAQAEELVAVMLPDGAASADNELWMIDEGGRPVAYLWVHPRPDADEVYVQDVLVEEGHQGRGLGRRIMSRAAASAAERGLSSVRLHVFAHNMAANALYDRLGYRPIAEHRRRTLDV